MFGRKRTINQWQEQLAALEQYFPGSKTPLLADRVRELQKEVIDKWDDKPHRFSVNGVEQDFFTIGQVAMALGNRSANTLRAWEKDGTIPKTRYMKNSHDPRGRRRMYSRAMVEGMIRIAEEEGVLFPNKGIRISDTKFTERVQELFNRLTKK